VGEDGRGTVSRTEYDQLGRLQAAYQQAMGLPDVNNVVNYQRSYQYDSGGNLLRIQHQGAQSYSNEMVASSRSNRALAQGSNSPITPDHRP
jgi:uncharacterized protein RhaS with RHS repeats